MNFIHVLNSIGQVITTFITLVSLIFPSQINYSHQYEARNPDELIASFSVVSDTHVETTDAGGYHTFTELLRGIKGGKNIDAAVYLGDNVMNGQFFESMLFYSTVNRISPAKTNLAAVGNHDIGNGEGDYNELLQRFYNFNSRYLNNELDKAYYYKVINGCYLIFLGSDDLGVHSSTISDEQYLWLEELLGEASSQHAPIVVFNHHPVTAIEGEERHKLLFLLSEYDNLIYVSGHTHMKLTERSFRNIYGLQAIYLPRSVGADYPSGDGIVIEVYEDKIFIRPRNFITGEWIEDLEQEYPLK